MEDSKRSSLKFDSLGGIGGGSWLGASEKLFKLELESELELAVWAKLSKDLVNIFSVTKTENETCIFRYQYLHVFQM